MITLEEAARAGDRALLTPAETASALRVSTKTLERWRSLGLGPKTTKIGPRRLAYRVVDVLAFVSPKE